MSYRIHTVVEPHAEIDADNGICTVRLYLLRFQQVLGASRRRRMIQIILVPSHYSRDAILTLHVYWNGQLAALRNLQRRKCLK